MLAEVFQGSRPWWVEAGDNRKIIEGFKSWSIDSVVCDPPYGLDFMGRQWDQSSPAFDVSFWKSVRRVVRPGAHLVAFGGTRTWHRLAVAIEDAGWEIRDSLAWIYGQGFPKNHDVAKAIDKRRGHWRGRAGKPKASDSKRALGQNYERTAKGEPVTAAAAEWDGHGTALKPSIEPIVLARAPLRGNIAETVEEHGTGTLNLEACRVGDERRHNPSAKSSRLFSGLNGRETDGRETDGRWPPNVLVDGIGRLEGKATEVFPVFEPDYDDPFFYHPKASKKEREAGLREAGLREAERDSKGILVRANELRAQRRAPIIDQLVTREESREGKLLFNVHPTVKPIAVMRWLTRLVTPPGGIVLDPFTGSGTTGVAAVLEKFRFVGCELTDSDEEPFVRIARARIAHWVKQAA